MKIRPGGRYRDGKGYICFVVRVDPGRVPAYLDPVDLEFVVEDGPRNVGHRGVSTIEAFELFEEVAPSAEGWVSV